MIILFAEHVLEHLRNHELHRDVNFPLTSLDEGDVFTSQDSNISRHTSGKTVRGMLRFESGSRTTSPIAMPSGIDVLVIAHLPEDAAPQDAHLHTELSLYAQVSIQGRIEERPVRLVPLRDELFSRVRGIYETAALSDKQVLIIGLGSGGSAIAIELAKAGVTNYSLVDHDRLELVNVVRHACGIADIGRYKTRAVRDLILDKNPYANVETHQVECNEAWLPVLKTLVQHADLVFCCTDNRPSRTLINRACVQEGKTCIYGGTFSRAYGGHVLRVVPYETMCYQCFVDMLPDVVEDYEIANQRQADEVDYGEGHVAVEPGLASDIAPIANMCVKVGILELLRGRATTLTSLYQDLASPWFQWLNRREVNTEYESLEPMDIAADGPRILAWYGITSERNPACPTCGDFVGTKLAGTGLRLTEEDISAWAPDTHDKR